jgi:hypothetical protein
MYFLLLPPVNIYIVFNLILSNTQNNGLLIGDKYTYWFAFKLFLRLIILKLVKDNSI